VAKDLSLSSQKLENGKYLITATAIDDKVLRCLDIEDCVYFQVLEGGKTLKFHGTPTGKDAIEMASGKAAIELIPDTSLTDIKVMVLNQNFKGTYLTVKK
jgi:beta-galactosidase